MKSLFARKITPLINLNVFGAVQLRVEKKFFFPIVLKVIFVVCLTFLLLQTMFFDFLNVNFGKSASDRIIFKLIYHYGLILILLSIIFFLNHVNTAHYILRIFSPLLFYILWIILSDLLVLILDNQFDLSWLFNEQYIKVQTQKLSSWKVIALLENFIYPILVCLFIPFFFYFEKSQLKQIYHLIKTRPLFILIFIGFVFGILILVFASDKLTFNQTTLNVSENENRIQMTMKNMSTFGKIFFTIMLVLLVPFYEELLYRFCLQKVFANNRNQGWVFFILFSTIVFALVHINYSELGISSDLGNTLHNIFVGVKSTNIVYWYLSYVLVCVYFLSGYNLLFPIIIHMANNALSSILTLLN